MKIRTEDENVKYTKRLNRIEGQIRGINKMINTNRECDEIMIQIAASISALKSLGGEILHGHMKNCMVREIKNNNLEVIDEVTDIFRKLV